MLINEIINFCDKYKLLENSENLSKVMDKIEEQLNNSEFVEELIHFFIIKTKNHKDINTGQLITILIELERIRLELEYK
jgi:hypothetical protein